MEGLTSYPSRAFRSPTGSAFHEEEVLTRVERSVVDLTDCNFKTRFSCFTSFPPCEGIMGQSCPSFSLLTEFM